MFIRKLLDFCFTKRELSWLDDLIPESNKKKEDDKKKKLKEVRRAKLGNGVKVESGNGCGVVSVQDAERMLEDGEDDLPYDEANILKFPIKQLKGR